MNDSQAGDPSGRMNSGPTTICLDDFIKRSGLVGTGGEAKVLIQSGEVQVNGEVETRRRKKLAINDTVELFGETLTVDNEFFD